MSESPTVFFSYSIKTNREVISQLMTALKAHGYELTSDADIAPGDSFIQSIHQMIERSDFIIVDVTGSNPNVMYEVGFAQGLGKSILPIVQESQGHVSAHIAGMLYVPYDPLEPDKMIKYVLSWVKRRQPEPQRMAI